MTDEHDILRIHERWIALELAGRQQEVLTLCSEDVAWLVPGEGMLRGKDQVRSWLDAHGGSRILSIDTCEVTVEVSGGLAVKTADFRTRFMHDGLEQEARGAHLWTLRRAPGPGGWLVSRVAWAMRPPLPGACPAQSR